MTLFSPNGGGSGTGTARLLDATSGAQVASVPLNTGDTTFDLSGVAVAAHQSLRVVFDLQSSDGQATPRVQAFKVLYDSAVPCRRCLPGAAYARCVAEDGRLWNAATSPGR